MKKPLLTYRILFLCAGLLLAAASSMQAQAPCRKFVQAAIGGNFGNTMIAIANDGTLWTWGYNGHGELGLGYSDYGEILVPTQVGTDHDWKEARVGHINGFAVKTNGTLWSWGDNYHGQLGLGYTSNPPTQFVPARVGTATDWDLHGVNLNRVGSFSCAFKTNHSLWAWGRVYGSAEYKSEDQPELVPINDPSRAYDWKGVWLDEDHRGRPIIFAIKANGTLWRFYNFTMPTQIGTDADWKTMVVSGDFQLAIKEDGTLWSWGDNTYGQLGNGRFGGREDLPQQVIDISRDWKEVAGSTFTSYALKNDGTLWSWGRGDYGPPPKWTGRESTHDNDAGLGDGTRENREVPTQVGVGVYKSIMANEKDVIALGFDGSLWGWGGGIWTKV